MKIALYMIEGGDYKKAGTATESLKKLLKQINVHPADQRRTVIAAFEAEMNVVIHANQGSMRVIIDPSEIEVEVRDQGPGIPDLALAMKEGFSTAPDWARRLGYGAGMGLPNIKKNSDEFEISSTVGKGSTLTFLVKFRPFESAGASRNSIRLKPENCRDRRACLRACPTRALRVRGGGPELIQDLCIDCGACLEACTAGAIAMAPTPETLVASASKTLVVPTPFLSQFSAKAPPPRALQALERLGFGRVLVSRRWELGLRQAARRWAREKARVAPAISPVCPAVMNLIALRFHSLFENVAPFLSPFEAAKLELAGQAAAFVATCPSQLTLLGAEDRSPRHEAVPPETLRRLVQPRLIEGEFEADAPAAAPVGPAEEDGGAGTLEATGLTHVFRVLERVENGRLRDARLLELYACEGGCFGSPLFTEEPSIARYRWERTEVEAAAGPAAPRRVPLAARPGLRLDRDVDRALAKVVEMEELGQGLPGKDCGRCGSPTCMTLAEDVIRGRAEKRACPYLSAPGGTGP